MKFALICLALVAGASAQFSTTAQTAIVKAHNDLRSTIALGNYNLGGSDMPTAANMRKLKWDTTIAASAQKYANTCPDDHSGYPDLGENLYWYWSTANPTSLDSFGAAAAKSWAQEFIDYGWYSTTLDQEAFDSGIGHATQMVWALTSKIGCGVKACGRDATMNNMYRISVVCQYSEQGNVVDDDIYQAGDVCSFCQTGTKCETASGLCV